MASFLRRASVHVLRNVKQRGGGHGWPGGSFWAEGTQTGRNGYIFGETPPPPGQKRKWESWELVFYTGFGIAGIMAFLTVNGPDNSLQSWAKQQALKELVEEDATFTTYAADKQLQKDMADKFMQMGKHPDRYYDAVMMRNEYAILKARHTGVPP
eukprot:GHRR01000883.1.p1 GENE.GHRR01000883.1~~GHRR01000883.1.p1  ORF type:complete len:155 (+),score=49.44 GHRR01000883.1:159-623(+)